MIKAIKRFKTKTALLHLVMLLLVCFMALPLVYLVVTAFKPLDELFAFPPRFFVRRPTLNNFTELLAAMDVSSVPFTRYFFNSAVVSAITVAMSIFVCSLATYSMTKMNLPLKNLYFSVIVATLMFSPSVTQVSSYIIITKLNLVNSLLALIVPKIAGAYFFFLLKQNMEQIPNAIVESAKIDGCSYFGIYLRMILPLSRPVLATIVVFSFIASWNDFYAPLLYINREELKTLPLALQALQGGAGQVARTGAMGAAAFLTTLPTILIFLFMQSKVIKTMAHSGIK